MSQTIAVIREDPVLRRAANAHLPWPAAWRNE